jgi:hypothetical protein
LPFAFKRQRQLIGVVPFAITEKKEKTVTPPHDNTIR